MIGREVFGYRVEELIGKGSFASVYKVKKENECPRVKTYCDSGENAVFENLECNGKGYRKNGAVF